MKGFLSKISIIFFFFLSLFFFSASPSFAQAKTTQVNNSPVVTANPDVPNNLHNWTQSVMIEVMSSLSCQLTGIDPTTPNKQCLGFNQKTGKIGFLPAGNLKKGEIGGAIGGMTSMISVLYTPPLHTSDYFQNLAQNFGITKKTYAQTTGVGFQGLSPLIGVWSAFRNVVYLFLVIIFVVIGLAIMLRVKIDPRTVMTIQNQIPKIIVGILLVTFSFAIAGFLIDMMWVFIYLIYGLISGASADIATSVSHLNPTLLQGKNPLQAVGNINDIVAPVATGSREIIQKMLGIGSNIMSYIPFVSLTPLAQGIKTASDLANVTDPSGLIKINGLPNISLYSTSPISYLIDLISGAGGILLFLSAMKWPAITIIGNSLGWASNVPVAGIVGVFAYDALQYLMREGLPWLIIYLIVLISLLVALFRLWFMLLMSYVSILLDVVLAPFWIIGGIIPGSQISFSGWLKDVGANLLAFPATIFMLLIGKVFMDGFANSTNPFAPPLIGDLGDPTIFSSLIGIGVILMTPNVVNMLKAALKAPKFESNIGAAIAPGTTVPISTGRSIGSTIIGSRETVVVGQDATGAARWGTRSGGETFLRGLFRRG